MEAKAKAKVEAATADDDGWIICTVKVEVEVEAEVEAGMGAKAWEIIDTAKVEAEAAFFFLTFMLGQWNNDDDDNVSVAALGDVAADKEQILHSSKYYGKVSWYYSTATATVTDAIQMNNCQINEYTVPVPVPSLQMSTGTDADNKG